MDYPLFDDKTFEKLAKVVEDQSKIVQIVDTEDEADLISKQLNIQGYNTKVEKNINGYQVIAKPKEKVEYKEALNSGQFKKVAFGRYTFNRNANNPLGIQHYNFDDGTIWKIMKGKDGKEYLVKEVEDNDEEKVIRNTKNITASIHRDTISAKKICLAMYDNKSKNIIDDLFRYIPNQTMKMVEAKFNKFIEDEAMKARITSPKLILELKNKVIDGINKDSIFTQDQMRKLISKATRR